MHQPDDNLKYTLVDKDIFHRIPFFFLYSFIYSEHFQSENKRKKNKNNNKNIVIEFKKTSAERYHLPLFEIQSIFRCFAFYMDFIWKMQLMNPTINKSTRSETHKSGLDVG